MRFADELQAAEANFLYFLRRRGQNWAVRQILTGSPRRWTIGANLSSAASGRASRRSMESLAQQQPSFEQLLDRARDGCTSAAGELLETFRGYLLVVANGQLNAQLRVKFGGSDLVQQTLMNAHRELGQFRGRSERELIAWLQRILINEVARVRRDYRTTAKRNLAREVPLDPVDASHRGDGVELRQILRRPAITPWLARTRNACVTRWPA